MKKARKLITFILTVVMVLSMSMNVWAAQITINDGDVTDAEYSAYKLLSATDLGDGKFFYTVNPTYRQILIDAIGNGDLTDEDIIAYIKGRDTADTIRTFANNVYAEIKKATLSENDFEVTSTNVFDDVDQGYYLIAETDLGDWGEGQSDDTYSLVMLDTAGNTEITVDTKEAHPTLSKQITGDDNNVNDDIADGVKNNLSVGSKVQFELSTTIPIEAKQYDYYYCIFSDLLSEGLTFDASSLAVTQGETPLDTNAYVLYTGDDADGNTFQVALLDAKSLAGEEIKVIYWATLNEKAEIGEGTGNTNTAILKYSNDPNTEYGDYENPDDPKTPGKPDPNPTDPDTGESLPSAPMGETPEQETNTYTTGIKIEKIDGEGQELTGAEFHITGENMKVVLVTGYKFVEDPVNGTYYKLKNGSYTKTAPDASNEKEYDDEKRGITFGIQEYSKEVMDSTESVDVKAFVDDKGCLTFEGLGEGTYTIEEVTVPAGYNKAANINVKIEWNPTGQTWTATIGEDPGTPLNFENGVFELPITNLSGSELPSTGGIGTTIFYIVGGALVLFAVVLLVTKKRMKDAQ